ncbi:MAG: PD40 domain-containing protein [Bacteroidales bacterium]|nr:PD40 domain-containing protein [Candidatus Colimorpha onthohippi]
MTRYRYLVVIIVISMCPLAQAQEVLQLIHLSNRINTIGNESAVTQLDGRTLLYSSLPHNDGKMGQLSLDEVLMQIMTARVDAHGMPYSVAPVRRGLNKQSKHVGNTAYDPRSHTLYYTECEPIAEGSPLCALYKAQYNDDRWLHAQRLPKNVNMEGYTATHPAVSYLDDGTLLLYFVSNRPGGEGGLDLWYTIIDAKGNPSNPVNLGRNINSPYDEVTPFYDSHRQLLYFSSNRPGGMGGFDVYVSFGNRNRYSKPNPMVEPLNSPYNDIYYMATDSTFQRGYISSNRKDALFAVDSFCCNDLYLWQYVPAPELADNPEPQEPTLPEPEQPQTIPQQPQPNGRKLPVLPEPPLIEDVTPSPEQPIVLFFHNDEPDPGSNLTTTTVSYDAAVQRYIAMRQHYKDAWRNECDDWGMDSVGMLLDYFFDTEVKGNYDRLNDFMWIMAEKVWEGHQVTLTIRGFASPLASSDYNDKLSARRISSFMNYLRQWNQGTLRRPLADGSLRIVQAPMGSTTAAAGVSASVSDQTHSVYSIEAARERRIELIQYQFE